MLPLLLLQPILLFLFLPLLLLPPPQQLGRALRLPAHHAKAAKAASLRTTDARATLHHGRVAARNAVLIRPAQSALH